MKILSENRAQDKIFEKRRKIYKNKRVPWRRTEKRNIL